MATQVEPIERVMGAFSDNPVYDVLLHRLAEIVCTWRGVQAPDLVVRYNAVLLSLIELGFSEPLDIDICLPSKLMAADCRRDGWHIRTTILEPVKEPQKS